MIRKFWNYHFYICYICFSLNARFGTVAVPNIMLFHQSRSAIRFNHTERNFENLVQFIQNTTGTVICFCCFVGNSFWFIFRWYQRIGEHGVRRDWDIRCGGVEKLLFGYACTCHQNWPSSFFINVHLITLCMCFPYASLGKDVLREL